MDKKRTVVIAAIFFLVQAILLTGTASAEIYSTKPFAEFADTCKLPLNCPLFSGSLDPDLTLPDVNEILRDCPITPNSIYQPSQVDFSV